jgi:hypothetical protein
MVLKGTFYLPDIEGLVIEGDSRWELIPCKYPRLVDPVLVEVAEQGRFCPVVQPDMEMGIYNQRRNILMYLSLKIL